MIVCYKGTCRQTCRWKPCCRCANGAGNTLPSWFADWSVCWKNWTGQKIYISRLRKLLIINDFQSYYFEESCQIILTPNTKTAWPSLERITMALLQPGLVFYFLKVIFLYSPLKNTIYLGNIYKSPRTSNEHSNLSIWSKQIYRWYSPHLLAAISHIATLLP